MSGAAADMESKKANKYRTKKGLQGSNAVEAGQ